MLHVYRACTIGNRTVVCRGFLFGCRQEGRPPLLPGYARESSLEHDNALSVLVQKNVVRIGRKGGGSALRFTPNCFAWCPFASRECVLFLAGILLLRNEIIILWKVLSCKVVFTFNSVSPKERLFNLVVCFSMWYCFPFLSWFNPRHNRWLKG